MSKHTPGRLRLFQVGDNLEFLCPATEDGESILTITHEGNTAFAVVLSDMNARRLAACWNACEGIETYALELMTGHLSIKEQITATGKQKPKQTRKTIEYRRQRDELLEALRHIEGVAMADEPRDLPGIVQTAHSAIAKATGEEA